MINRTHETAFNLLLLCLVFFCLLKVFVMRARRAASGWVFPFSQMQLTSSYFSLLGKRVPRCEHPYDGPPIMVHFTDTYLRPGGCGSSWYVRYSLFKGDEVFLTRFQSREHEVLPSCFNTQR